MFRNHDLHSHLPPLSLHFLNNPVQMPLGANRVGICTAWGWVETTELGVRSSRRVKREPKCGGVSLVHSIGV